MNYIKLVGVCITMGCLGHAALAVPRGWPAESPGEERPPGMFTVAEDVVTPHTAWAKPSAQPAPSILFIVPRWGGREVVELAQRMPMHYAVVLTGARDKYTEIADNAPRLWPSAERPSQTTKRLTAALAKPWDVVVVGNVLLSTLPTNVVQLLDAKVRAGTGLFITGNATNSVFANFVATATPQPVPEALTTTVPLTLLPAFTNNAAIPPFAAWQLGQGRVVAARYDPGSGGNMAVSPHLTITALIQMPVAYDYYQSLVVKALRYTAGCWSDGLTAGKTRVRLRDTNGRTHPPGELPAGQYFKDVWLLDNKDRVLDWRTESFTVTNAQGIASLTTATPAVAAGQEMELQLTLQQPLAAGESLTVETRDFYQRTLGRTNLIAGGSCRVPTAGCLSLVATATAKLERAGRLVEERNVSFPVVGPTGAGPGWDDFSFMVWNWTDSALADPVFHQLRAAGMDRLMTAAWSPPAEHIRQAKLVAERYDCRAFPYATWIGDIGGCRPERIRPQMGEIGRDLAAYGCDTFSMGDESKLGVGNTDQPLTDPWINGSFREYLQKQYPSLEALNTEWNSAFTNWNNVTGITLTDATNQNQVARWVDHRMHRETLFAAAFATGEQAVRTGNPRSRAGFEGQFQTDSFRGYDWAKLGAAMTLFGNYWFTPAEWDIIGSMKRPDTYWGFWNGAYMDVSNRRTQGWIAWRCLFHGMNSVWYWMPYWPASSDEAFGIYFPDLQENPVCVPFLNAVREIKSGPGKLLLNAQRAYAPVAIHYSQASVHANTLDDGGFTIIGAGIPSFIHSAWLTAAWSLKEAGFQPRFVPYNQIETGALKDYRVLILPFSQALSLAECQQIRAFVENGGVLVADVRPGLRDGHGKLQPHGLLDDLFGIERISTNRPAPPVDLKLDLVLGGRPIKGVLPSAQPDPAVHVTTGQALAHAGDTPLFITRKVGNGQTLLLNYAGQYAPATFETTIAPEIRTTAAGDLYREIALACAALGGVKPELSVPGLHGVDTITWKDGAATYYGFTPNDYCDYAWVITMPDLPVRGQTTQPGYFYDIRAGRYLGEGTKFQADLKNGQALLIARLPYRVAAVEVSGPKTAVPGQTVSFPVRVVARQGTAGNHVVHIEVTVNGRPLPYYTANLKAPGGEATISLPLALNAPSGQWEIIARDVASGLTDRWRFHVKGE